MICIPLLLTLVQVINFATAKTWQYPWRIMDIATSKCFFSRGNYFVTIATTRYCVARATMFYFAVCIFPWVGRLYSDGKTSQLRRQDVAIATALPKMKKTNHNYSDGDAIPAMVRRRYIDGKTSLYQRQDVAKFHGKPSL